MNGERANAEASRLRETEQLRRFYNRWAAGYDRWMQVYDALLVRDGRARLCSAARGQTLELAIGTGRNLAFYPRAVQLTGIDLSPAMLAVAARRARDLRLTVALRLGDAQALAFADNCFDTVVATLLLSSVPDGRHVADEARRVLKPGGQFLVLDHGRSPVAPVRWVERLLEPLMVRLTGSHLLRDALDYLEPVGFSLERVARSKWGLVEEVVARRT